MTFRLPEVAVTGAAVEEVACLWTVVAFGVTVVDGTFVAKTTKSVKT